jgi:hypothetical protein
VFGWSQAAFAQSLVYAGCGVDVRFGGRDRIDVGDDMRQMLVAGLADLNLVPIPADAALRAVARVHVVGADDRVRSGQAAVELPVTPGEPGIVLVVPLDPDLAQDFDRRQGADMPRRARLA